MATLDLDEIRPNPNGWGPSFEDLPGKFKDLPYQPFKKQDLIGKVSDWTGATYGESRRAKIYNTSMGGYGMNPYGHTHEDDETTFELVNNQKNTKPMFHFYPRRGGYQNRWGNQNNRWGYNNQQNNQNQAQNRANQPQRRRNNRNPYYYQRRHRVNITREASVKVEDEWKQMDTYDLANLGKLKSHAVSAGVDVLTCGTVKAFNKNVNVASLRNKQKLMHEKIQNFDFQFVSTMEDQTFREISKTLDADKISVLATDTIIATLMCMSRSVIPWDLVAWKYGNKLILDIDPERKEFSPIDQITVSETTNDPLPQDETVDEINKPLSLAEEAMQINQTISQQVLRHDAKSPKMKGDRAYPFPIPDGRYAPSRLYRYRKFFLDGDKKDGKDKVVKEGKVQLIVRAEVDAYEPGKDKAGKDAPTYCNIKALNEWNSKYCNGIDWKKFLDKQTSTILATEIKNNSFKISKWIMCAILAGSSSIKLAYVSRDGVKENEKHNLVNMESYSPEDLAQVAGLNIDNCWGILRCIVDKLANSADGKYCIVRAPNDKEVSMYRVERNDGESDTETESESSSSESEEEVEAEPEEKEEEEKSGSGSGSDESSSGSEESSSGSEESGSEESGSDESGSEEEEKPSRTTSKETTGSAKSSPSAKSSSKPASAASSRTTSKE